MVGVAATGSPAKGNEDVLQAAIVLIRHGVRAPLDSEIRANKYNTSPWPTWPVDRGVLTQHGADALAALGSYYRQRYSALLPSSSCGSPLYVEANSAQRTQASAKALYRGLQPECTPNIRMRPRGEPNPLFTTKDNPTIDHQRLAAAIRGRLANRLDWYNAAFAEPLSQMEVIVGACTLQPCAKDRADLRGAPAVIEPVSGNGLVKIDGPVSIGADFAEHFLLQYAEGFPLSEVGWGKMSRTRLNELMKMNTQFHDFVLRTPLFAQAGASNLAGRIFATLRSINSDQVSKGALGKPGNRVFFLVGHDSNLAWLGGLLRLDWLLPDETFNATPPGSALVFELSKSAQGASFVRGYFISQTLDQIRNLTTLIGPETPAVAPLFIPGCSMAGDYACKLDDFGHVVEAAINPSLLEMEPAGR